MAVESSWHIVVYSRSRWPHAWGEGKREVEAWTATSQFVSAGRINAFGRRQSLCGIIDPTSQALHCLCLLVAGRVNALQPVFSDKYGDIYQRKLVFHSCASSGDMSTKSQHDLRHLQTFESAEFSYAPPDSGEAISFQRRSWQRCRLTDSDKNTTEYNSIKP